MDRQAFLDWAALLLEINHTGERPYVSKQRGGLSLGVDADGDGTMRVHLFASLAPLSAWLKSQPSLDGPMPKLARPVFRQGASGGDRYYYGFTWEHDADRDYASEQPAVQAFVAWLQSIARQQAIDL